MDKYNFDSENVFKYITEPNAPIYRAIMRLLYEKHMSLEHHSTTQSDIYLVLREHNVVDASYTEAHLQESLKRLEEWEAIISDKAKRKGITIEEFKKNRYTYQLTDVGIEIESLLIRIDELDEKLIGGMKSRQFGLLLKHLELLRDASPKYFSSNEKLIEVWSNVFDTHKTLRNNATNYLYHIQKAEKANLFNSELFLEFKDTIIQYLGSFITELSRAKHKINKVLLSIEDAHIEDYVDSIIAANESNAILYDNFSPEKLRFSLRSKWLELKAWFLGTNGIMSDVDILTDKTNEAISMIVSYANRLSDTNANSQSRIDDYKTLAKKFYEVASVNEANLLFTSTLGVFHSRSLYVLDEIDIIENGKYSSGEEIWGTNTIEFHTPNMSNRGPRGTSKASTIKNNKIQQQRRIIERLEKRKKEEASIRDLIKDGKIILCEVEELQAYQRKVILKWLKRTTKQRTGQKGGSNKFRTETGLVMQVRYRSKTTVKIKCDDGILSGPDIEIIFEGDFQ